MDNNKRLNVAEGMIELTRRCNMACPHCLRGDAENVDINKADIDSFFRQVGRVSTLTLTGGEPSLVPYLIEYVVESAEKHNTEIGSFYVVTNGKKVSNEFMTAMLNLYMYCDDNEFSGLALSTDQFHDDISRENLKKLKAFSFYQEKGEIAAEYVIYEGRGTDFQNDIQRQPDEYYIDEYDGLIQVAEGMVYLNAKGNLIRGCDWSFENQDDTEHDCFMDHVSQLYDHFEAMAELGND